MDENHPEGPQFHRMYLCFDALKKGWKTGCRPVIGLDGCFLKTYTKGELLTTVGRDGNNQMYPIAWAVVEVESTDSWTWFLTLLMTDLQLDDGQGITLISDQQKGLTLVVNTVLPKAEHRYCARHVYVRWRTKFPGIAYRQHFWVAVKAYNKPEWLKHMKKIKDLDPAAYHDLHERKPWMYCKSFFDINSSCDSADNNMCEAFNSSIVQARFKPITSMLEEIRKKVMVRMHENRDKMMKGDRKFPKRIQTKLDDNIRDSGDCEVTWNGEDKYEIGGKRGGYMVDLGRRTCTCREWDLCGIPCVHACAAICHMDLEPANYIRYWFSREKYLASYNNMLQPLNGPTLWPSAEHLKPLRPPSIRKMPGRPQRKRRLEEGEEKKKRKRLENGAVKTKVSRKGCKQKCSVCKSLKHRKTKCPLILQSNADDVSKKKDMPESSQAQTECSTTQMKKGKEPMKNQETGKQTQKKTLGLKLRPPAPRKVVNVNELSPSFVRRGKAYIRLDELQKTVQKSMFKEPSVTIDK